MTTYTNEKMRGILTTDHPESKDGIPVLVIDGIAYHSKDILPNMHDDELSWLQVTARHHVLDAYYMAANRPELVDIFVFGTDHKNWIVEVFNNGEWHWHGKLDHATRESAEEFIADIRKVHKNYEFRLRIKE